MTERSDGVAKMNDVTLKATYCQYFDLIYNVDCYGSSDLEYLELMDCELHRRGYEIKEVIQLVITKKKLEGGM